jgi:hypothetical protein
VGAGEGDTAGVLETAAVEVGLVDTAGDDDASGVCSEGKKTCMVPAYTMGKNTTEQRAMPTCFGSKHGSCS